jgi:error-prone DNA polymerase
MNSPHLADYAELDCLSNFSFLTGASHPEELVQRAAQLGYQALALADECSLAGVVRAHTEAELQKIKLIIGSRFKIRPGSLPTQPSLAAVPQVPAPSGAPASPDNAEENSPPGLEIIVLARNRTGYGDLSELITLARSRRPKGHYDLSLDDILDPKPGWQHLQGLPDCLVIFKPAYGLDAGLLQAQIETLLAVFPRRLWLGLTLHHSHDDARHRAQLEQAARTHGIRLVATGQVEMHRRSRQPLHDTLAAIRLKQAVQHCGYALKPNAEHHLRSRLRLTNLYPAQALEETLRLSRLCTFSLEEIKYEYPTEIVPEGLTLPAYLRQETYAGARNRYPQGISSKIRAQLETELAIIAELEYEAYFLTVYDIVLFARRHDILCQGRGSAANSAVCYCLHITEVDPENGNALFARFISRERNEPPDIDVDFEHQRREEVIQYIYRKYGHQRAALTAVVTTYRTRSVLRDTGKALGIDPDLIARVTKSFHYWDGKKALLEKIAEQGFDPQARIVKLWANLAQKLMGFPRHLSQHPGGFVISRGKLSRLVPIENAAMPERSVVQWDKDDLDAMNILKIDILALGMLSALQRALKLLSAQRAQPFTLQAIPVGDTPTYDMICRADTIGVFQIESRAQMSMLPRLKPREFYDLVIQVAIVRPGPIQGGMVHPYLQRRHNGTQESDYLDPKIKHILLRTLGVPIFQEQVMQVAMTAADFTADEADQLRRSMAAWRRKGGVEKFRERLLAGMKKNGYDSDFAQALLKHLEGFGEYGFPESHSASFAQLAYFSAWIKCHEPEIFLTSLLNSQPMGFYAPSQLVQDARRHGVAVLPVDIAASQWEAALAAPAAEPPPGKAPCNLAEPGSSGPQDKALPGESTASRCAKPAMGPALPPRSRPAVRLGLNQVSGLPQAAGLRIESARTLQAFATMHDLAVRAGLNRHEMDALAAAGALASLAGHRRIASWQAANAVFKGLLREAPINESSLPDLPPPTRGQDVIADYQSLGLTLRQHPLALLRPALEARQFSCASALIGTCPDRRLARACGIVIMRQRPQTAKGIIFISIEDETGSVNAIVRPELALRQRTELLQARLLGIYGIWQRHQGVCHLIAKRLVDLSPLLGELAAPSRNFH